MGCGRAVSSTTTISTPSRSTPSARSEASARATSARRSLVQISTDTVGDSRDSEAGTAIPERAPPAAARHRGRLGEQAADESPAPEPRQLEAARLRAAAHVPPEPARVERQQAEQRAPRQAEREQREHLLVWRA